MAAFIGEVTDSIFILVFIAINTFLGFYEEFKSEKSLKLLKKYVSEKAHVLRDGKIEFLDIKKIVPDDLLILKEGDKIPADLKFIETKGMEIDESILSGESAPVPKDDNKNNLGFAGTMVVGGEACALVLATGNNTKLGKIAKTTSEIKDVSAFSMEMNSFSSFIIKLVLISMVVLFILKMVFQHESFSTTEFIIFAIALSVGVIPEALPVVITTALASGALHLAKKKVIPRRLSAIEDLGNINVLCTDKTGTITENKLEVLDVFGKNKDEVIELATLASSFLSEKSREASNSFDIALWNYLKDEEKIHFRKIKKIAELPFDPGRRRNNAVINMGKEKILISRGAFEKILLLCNKIPDLKKIQNSIAKEGEMGHRVLAIAKKKIKISKYQIDNINIEKEEKNLEFCGYITFADPLKSDAKHAIIEAEKLGIGIKIITGDSVEVAGAIAKEINLIKDQKYVISGQDYEKLSVLKKHEIIEKSQVFARISPLQKLEMINFLKEKHKVGYIGEGFNDVPALKAAHVGLVVDNASDIAKDTAEIVLLDHGLNVIIDGVKEGRKIFVNSFKYIKTTLISNFGNFYALVLATTVVSYLPMLPIQILLLNLLSDSPMISIATDNVDDEELRKPSTFGAKEVITIALLLGLISTIFDFSVFWYFKGFGRETLRTMWFIESVLTEILLIFCIRRQGWFWQGKKPSIYIFGFAALAIAVTLILPYTHFGQSIFYFVKPNLHFILVAIGLAVLYFASTEVAKRIYYSRVNRT